LSRLKLLDRPLPVFAALSLLAVAVGAAACALSGVPAAGWGRNLAAWAIGGMAAVALARWAGPRAMQAAAVLGPVAIWATFLNDAQQGVHRWLDLGPLHINAAMLMSPAFVVAFAMLIRTSAVWWLAAALALAGLAVQPDASQATALALAVAVAGFRAGGRAIWGWLGAAGAVALAALAWTRPDPLTPVPEVEEAARLALEVSPILGALAIAAMVATALAPAIPVRAGPAPLRRTGAALAILLLGWCVAPALGAFPTPFIGVGPSAILGAWLGVGLLAASLRPGAGAAAR
jgi:cell division protein FtsW (lipid II flippase)